MPGSPWTTELLFPKQYNINTPFFAFALCYNYKQFIDGQYDPTY